MISAASEHAAAAILRRSGTVAGTGCIGSLVCHRRNLRNFRDDNGSDFD